MTIATVLVTVGAMDVSPDIVAVGCKADTTDGPTATVHRGYGEIGKSNLSQFSCVCSLGRSGRSSRSAHSHGALIPTGLS